jgi:protein-disulfide isomerase
MTRLRHPIGPGDHILGPGDAPATLLEYGDYECPHCARAFFVVEAVRERLGNRMRYVFRHFPLRRLHPHALLAAQAAEAAGAQGQFWPMHAMLFEHQAALEPEDLASYAEALALNVVRFADDLRADATLARVEEDFRSGIRSGVNGTPTFFINDERFDEGWDVEILVASLAKAAAESRAGAARSST